jgi:hypothetical protein
LKHLLIIFSFLFLSDNLQSQISSDSAIYTPRYKKGVMYVFKTSVGTTHTGFVVNETADFITIENRNNHETLDIRKSEILSGRPINERKTYEADVLGDNEHAGNYLFSSSAFEFDEGAIVSNNHWLVLQNVDYAVSKNLAITTNAIAFYPFSLGVKCAFRVGELSHVGANIFGMANVLSSDRSQGFLLGYGAQLKYTHGTTNKNLTFSGGLLGLSTSWLSIQTTAPYVNMPFVSLGYCNRFNENVAFVAECWYLTPSASFIGGAGLKLVGNDSYSWSFGLYSFLNNSNGTFSINLKSAPIPYVGISRKFK